MPTYDQMSDAQIAAEQASLAFRAGRLDLGWEFARIALRARDIERKAMPQPIMPATPVHDEVHDSLPIPRLYDGRQAPPDATNIFEPQGPTSKPTKATARCTAEVLRDQRLVPCHHGIALWENRWPDHSLTYEWRHVNEVFDGDHAPLPSPEANELAESAAAAE